MMGVYKRSAEGIDVIISVGWPDVVKVSFRGATLEFSIKQSEGLLYALGNVLRDASDYEETTCR